MADNLYDELRMAWGVASTSGATIFGVEIAIVTNVRDPEKQGRVKVCFPTLPGKPESDWARRAQPAAGRQRGFYWVPEVNDEVLVAFERGQASKPYVLGALWNGQDAPMADAYTDENTTRMLQSKSGHRIVLSDKDGEEKIVIGDMSGKRVLTFDVKNKKLVIEAGAGDVEFKAEKKIVLECEDLEIKASKSASMKAGTFELLIAGKGSIQAGPELNLKASRIDINPSSAAGSGLASLAWKATGAVAAAAGAQGKAGAGGSGRAGAAGGGGADAGGSPGPAASARARSGGGDLSSDVSPAGSARPAAAAESGAKDPQAIAGAAAGAQAAVAGKVSQGEVGVQLVNSSGAARPNVEVELTLPASDKRAGKTDASGTFKVDGIPASGGKARLELPDITAVAPAAADAAISPDRVRYQVGGIDVPLAKLTVVELPQRVHRARMQGLHFDTDKAFLLPSAMAGMRMLVKLYKSFDGMVVLINGHSDLQAADKPGGAEYNRRLSQSRAESVRAFLTNDAQAWQSFYAPKPHPDQKQQWGTREDQLMLATVTDTAGQPFYRGAIDGKNGLETTAAFLAFQTSRGIGEKRGKVDGETRREMSRAYMQLEGTSLPAGTSTQSHGCGHTHPLLETVGDLNPNQPKNRRVEVYLFEDEVTPAPRTPCPSAGCVEHAQWGQSLALDVDLDQPPGILKIKVVGPTGRGILSAQVHASGPLRLDGKGAAVAFDEIAPGMYRVIASANGFKAKDAQVAVFSGRSSEETLALEPVVFTLSVRVEDTADSPQPILNATVSTDRAGVAPQTTGKDGLVEFTNLAPGAILFSAVKEGFSEASVPTTVGLAPAPPDRSRSSFGGSTAASDKSATKPVPIRLAQAFVRLRIRLLDMNGKPFALTRCEFDWDGKTIGPFTTTADGVLEADLPAFKTRGFLVVFCLADPNEPMTFQVFLPDFGPPDQLPGARARLSNLGYGPLLVTNESDPEFPLKRPADDATTRALQRFQSANGLVDAATGQVTGALDARTIARLLSAHDTNDPLVK